VATLETERVYSFYPGALHGAIKFKMKTPLQTPKLYDNEQWDDSEDGEEECVMRAVYVLGMTTSFLAICDDLCVNLGVSAKECTNKGFH